MVQHLGLLLLYLLPKLRELPRICLLRSLRQCQTLLYLLNCYFELFIETGTAVTFRHFCSPEPRGNMASTIEAIVCSKPVFTCDIIAPLIR